MLDSREAPRVPARGRARYTTGNVPRALKAGLRPMVILRRRSSVRYPTERGSSRYAHLAALGFHVHTAVWVPEDDRAFATRLARYCARNPVALERLTYDRSAKAVKYRSGKSEGPTAGTETVDPLEFLARVLVHIPDKGHVTTRYYGWCQPPRGMRDKAAPATADGPRRTGRPPMGSPAPADLRGQPARVPDLPWPHAGRRVYYPGLGDRPDPRASPDPRRARGARRAAEPPSTRPP